MLTSVFFITSLLVKTNRKSEAEGLRHVAFRKVHLARSKFTLHKQKLFAKLSPEITVFVQPQKMTLGKSNVIYKFGQIWADLPNRKDLLFGSYGFFKYRLMAALIEVSVACFVKQLYCFVA